MHVCVEIEEKSSPSRAFSYIEMCVCVCLYAAVAYMRARLLGSSFLLIAGWIIREEEEDVAEILGYDSSPVGLCVNCVCYSRIILMRYNGMNFCVSLCGYICIRSLEFINKR